MGIHIHGDTHVIEAREFIIALPESFTNLYEPNKLLQLFTDRIRESVDIFGSHPERLGSIIMTAVTALALLISKVLDKARELNRQNGIIFDAERERNELELEHDSLKGFARLTKKGELQSRIDRKNEEIELLKIGLSGIVKRYGLQSVHDFYKAFAAARTADSDYRDEADRWKERYGKNAHRKGKESVHNLLQNYQKENTDQHIRQTSKNRDKGAR